MTAEDVLTRTLREVTEHTDYPSMPIATVTRRARTLRARHRRTTVLAAVAAVAAVAAPAAVWLDLFPGGSPSPARELGSGPTSRPTRSTSPPPIASLDSLPRGARPGIDYADDATYVDMNGTHSSSGALRKARAVTPVRGGLLVALPTNLPDSRIGTLDLLTDHGDQGLGCGANRFAMSADGVESAYWVMDSCTTGSAGRLYTGVNNTMGEGGPSYVATPAGRVVQPVGFTSQGVVVNQTTPTGTPRGVWIYGSQAGPTRVPGLASAGGTDEGDDLISGRLAVDPSAEVVVHAATGVPVAYAPSWSLGQFSPDGKYVLGYAPGDGLGTDRYAVVDVATGRLVTELDHRGAASSLLQPVWESDTSVLAVAQDWTDRRDAIVRFDLQGHATRATAPRQEVDQNFPVYRLATRP